MDRDQFTSQAFQELRSIGPFNSIDYLDKRDFLNAARYLYKTITGNGQIELSETEFQAHAFGFTCGYVACHANISSLLAASHGDGKLEDHAPYPGLGEDVLSREFELKIGVAEPDAERVIDYGTDEDPEDDEND